MFCRVTSLCLSKESWSFDKSNHQHRATFPETPSGTNVAFWVMQAPGFTKEGESVKPKKRFLGTIWIPNCNTEIYFHFTKVFLPYDKTFCLINGPYKCYKIIKRLFQYRKYCFHGLINWTISLKPAISYQSWEKIITYTYERYTELHKR